MNIKGIEYNNNLRTILQNGDVKEEKIVKNVRFIQSEVIWTCRLISRR